MARVRPGRLIVLLSSLMAFYPLISGGIPNIADAALHLYRVVEFDAMLHRGVLYPRWASDLAFGYGYPLFNYYAPLLYYITEVPHLLGFGFESALKLVVFATFVLYGVGAYWWTRPILGEIPAIVAGVAYIYVPVRFHEAYRQGDYPQFLALALAPLALGATFRLFAAKRLEFRWVALLALAMAAIVLTHNISALLLAPTVGGYAIVVAVGRRLANRRCSDPVSTGWFRLAAAASAAVLAIGLAAFFWLPALAERGVVHLNNLVTDDFDVRNHFTTVLSLLAPPNVVDQTATNAPPYFQLGWGHLALALAGTAIVLALVFQRKRLARPLGSHLLFGWATVIVGAGMTLSPSTPIWRSVPLLAYTEYPTRFLGIAAIGSALLAGVCAYALLRAIDEFSRNPRRRAWTDSAIVAGSLILLIAPCLVYLYVDRSTAASADLTPADAIAFERTVGAVGTTSSGEFYPLDVTKRPEAPLPVNLDAIGRLDRGLLPPSSTVSYLGRMGYEERYTVVLPDPSTVRFNLIRFPGWQITVDGRGVATQPSPIQGLVQFDLPRGSHEVILDFVDTPLRQVSWAITYASVAALIGLALVRLARLKFVLYGLIESDAARRLFPLPLGEGWGEGRSPGVSSLERRPGTTLTPTFSQREREKTTPMLSQREREETSPMLVGCLVGLAFLALRVTSPAPYAAVFARQSPVDRIIGIGHPMLVQLEDKVEFLGYDVDGDTATPGTAIGVTLYWRARRPLDHDYRSLAMIASVDQKSLLNQDDRVHPGGIPTRAWRPDHYTIDRHEIPIPATAAAMVYQLQAALYDPATGAHLQQTGVDGFAGQQIVLQRIHIVRPNPVDLTRFKSANNPAFGDLIALQGYQVSSDRVKAGQSFQITYVWRANRPIDHDYTVFTHLVDANQKQVAGRDSIPVDGHYPTTQWIVGEQVVDTYDIAIPADASPGPHHLAVGFYDATTMQRLDASAKDWPGKRSQVDLDLPITIDGQ